MGSKSELTFMYISVKRNRTANSEEVRHDHVTAYVIVELYGLSMELYT